MILISKNEAEYIREHCGDVRVIRTGKKRKKYYTEDWSNTRELLEKYKYERGSK